MRLWDFLGLWEFEIVTIWDSDRDFQALRFRDSGIMIFCDFEFLRFWYSKILRFGELRFWGSEVTKFWGFEILRFPDSEIWDSEILRFWDSKIRDFEILGFWDFDFLKFYEWAGPNLDFPGDSKRIKKVMKHMKITL